MSIKRPMGKKNRFQNRWGSVLLFSARAQQKSCNNWPICKSCSFAVHLLDSKICIIGAQSYVFFRVFLFEFSQYKQKQKHARVGPCVSLTATINTKDLGNKLGCKCEKTSVASKATAIKNWIYIKRKKRKQISQCYISIFAADLSIAR